MLSRLAAAGYRIGYAGKWHLPREGDGALWGVERWHAPGEWSGPLAQRGYDFARDEVQRLEWGGAAPFAGRNTLPAAQTQEAWTADRAIEMVDTFERRRRLPSWCSRPSSVRTSRTRCRRRGTPGTTPPTYRGQATSTSGSPASRSSSRRSCCAGTRPTSPGPTGSA